MLTPEQARQVAQRTREIEERSEARTDAMLDRLIAKRMKHLQATTPSTTMSHSEKAPDSSQTSPDRK